MCHVSCQRIIIIIINASVLFQPIGEFIDYLQFEICMRTYLQNLVCYMCYK